MQYYASSPCADVRQPTINLRNGMAYDEQFYICLTARVFVKKVAKMWTVFYGESIWKEDARPVYQAKTEKEAEEFAIKWQSDNQMGF